MTPVMITNLIIKKLKKNLSDDLRKKQFKGSKNYLKGHCYVATEALFHLLGGLKSQWVPHSMKVDKEIHWFLKSKSTGKILDPTAKQFNFFLDYEKGRGRGFLTKEPSKRARILIERVRRG
jgi:hypothetical protein